MLFTIIKLPDNLMVFVRSRDQLQRFVIALERLCASACNLETVISICKLAILSNAECQYMFFLPQQASE